MQNYIHIRTLARIWGGYQVVFKEEVLLFIEITFKLRSMLEVNQNELLGKNVTLSSKARPVRVAYFIEDNECANLILDEVFAECYGRWGGVDTLIVPFNRGKMRPAYWEWLLSFDPDFIYSYVGLSDQIIQKIHHQILPSHFVMHPFDDDRPIEQQRLSPRFGMEMKALSCMSLIPFYNLRGTVFRPKVEAIIDAYPQWEDDGFLGDSFGFASRSTSTGAFPLDKNITDYAGTYLLTPHDAPDDRWRWSQNPKTTEINSANELLRSIAKKGSIVSVAQLSNALIPGPNPRSDRWPSITLVVGDTFKDRVYFWNNRLLRQNHETDMHFVGLRIPTQKLEDQDFIDALNKFFKWRHNFAGYDHSNKRFTLRSLSVSTKKLKQYSEKLKASQYWSVNYEKISSLDKIVPEKGRFPSYFGRIQQTETQEANQRNIQFRPPYPVHLSEISNVPPSLRTGLWYADTEISRHNNQSFYMNVFHWWQLPRREELLWLFMKPPSMNSRLEGRINKHGLLCVPCEHTNERVIIKIPEDEAIFRELLSAHYPSIFYDVRRDKIPHTAYAYIEFSEEGQYLNGVLGLFGNLHEAWHAIKERYWRYVFLDLCDPRKVVKENGFSYIREKIKKSLLGRNANSVEIQTEEDWDKLTEKVITTAFAVRNPQSHFSYTRLIERHDAECRQFFDLDPQSLHGESAEDAISERVPYLNRDIQDLCKKDVFSQGIIHLCKTCGHRNWFLVEDVKGSMGCQVCKSEFDVPLDHGWDFKLNPFLATCFREHGTMPLIWALGHLNYNAKNSFVYVAPLELYKEYPEQSKGRDAELDIVCIVDGRFIIGEVKRSAYDYKPSDLTTLANIIKKIRPDEVVLACFDHEPKKMQAKARDLRKLIPRTIDCKVRHICPGPDIEEPGLP